MSAVNQGTCTMSDSANRAADVREVNGSASTDLEWRLSTRSAVSQPEQACGQL